MHPSSLPPLTEEQRARIAANRARALEIQASRRQAEAAREAAAAACSDGVAAAVLSPTAADAAAHSLPHVQQPQPMRAASLNDAPTPLLQPSPIQANSDPLTAEQKAKIAANRDAALAKRASMHTAESSAEAATEHEPTWSDIFPHFKCRKSATAASTAADECQPSAGPSTAPVAAAATTAIPSLLQMAIPPLAPIFNRRATVSVVSSDRFKVKYPNIEKVTAALRKIPSRRWDDEKGVDTFAFSDIRAVHRVLSEWKEPRLTVVPLPENVVKILTRPESEGNDKSNLESGIDASLLTKLFPYQRKGVEFGISKGGRVLIADEMGLGKSIQALAIARFYRAEFPLVIVCPASVKSAWKQQIERFCPAIDEHLYVMQKVKDPLPGTEARTSNTVIIMSYDYLTRKRKDLANAKYGVWIFDESHYVKDSKSKRTKAALDVTKLARHVILLSGTPALSRPAELFSQIKLICRNLFWNERLFQSRYCDLQETKWGFEALGATNIEELSAILQKRLMIRRLKSEVLNDLPDKIRVINYLTSDEINSRMAEFRRTCPSSFWDRKKWNSSDENMLVYYTHTGTAKANPVCEHIVDNYFYEGSDDTRKILVFAHHLIVLDTIQQKLADKNVACIRIDGNTPSGKRGELCRQFQEDPSVRVAVLSITAAGQGITLTAASVVIFAEIYWIPGNMQQAEDRAHRVGQKDSVLVQYMLARHTADDLIWPLVQKKTDFLEQVNLNPGKFDNLEKKEIDMDAVTVDNGDDDDQPSTSKRRKS